jgi:hypothetical protein
MKKIKNWDETYSYWLTLKVPDIEFIPFDIDIHNPYFEWYYKKEKRQLHYHENPIKQTAFHISNHLKGKEKELVAGYKIFSIIRYADIFEFTDKIKPVFSKYGEDFYGWWSPNSKHLFPYFDDINEFDLSRREMRNADWKTIVDITAKFWTALANSLSIVIIPELMEYGSNEKKVFDNFQNELSKQREYQQYLRLKEKFESKPLL